MKLYKTTIVIWTDYNPEAGVLQISDLAREAMVGDAYCSKQVCQEVADPQSDPDWDGTEFFDDPIGSDLLELEGGD